MRTERFESGPVQYEIKGVESDMGEDTVMNLLVEADGDVIIELEDRRTGQRLEIQFCSFQGGTHHPGLAGKLREVALLLHGEIKA